MEVIVEPEDPLTLSMIEVTDDKVQAIIVKRAGINPKCPANEMSVLEHRRVEELYVRPTVETEVSDDDDQQDFTYRRVILNTDVDLFNNMNVDLHGAVFNNPKSQANEFLVWDVEKPESLFDTFQLTEEIVEALKKLQSDDPLKRAREIAKELGQHVTRLYGREDMNVFMDLVMHSPLWIKMTPNDVVMKGWLDCLIVGDTRTGKSQMAKELFKEYGVGELVSCEAASFAGVVGGLEKTNEGKWYVKWGAIPMHDKRIVAMDELSGLSLDGISLMSDLRSSGQVTLTKIESQRAHARTRLLWLGNPREGNMDNFRFAVDTLKGLIGRDEDIARFDMVMGAFKNDVSANVINQARSKPGRRKWNRQTLRWCLHWAWTRTADQILFPEDTFEAIRAASVMMGTTYENSPPLVQGENVRGKIGRIAASFALRTFSIDEDPEMCVVRQCHVQAAVDFLQCIYDNPRFGYKRRSESRQDDRKFLTEHESPIRQYVDNFPGMLTFLLDTQRFNGYTMCQALGLPNDSSNDIMGRLTGMKIVEMTDVGFFRVRPDFLRSIDES
jgi:hypothetical protein